MNYLLPVSAKCCVSPVIVLLWKTNNYFLYEAQHWAEMGLKNGTFAWYKLISCLQTSRKVNVLEKLEYDGLSKFYPAGIYFLQMDNRSTRVICEISSKLTIKTAERRHWRCSSVFIVNFEQISHIVLVVLLLLTLYK